MRPTGNLHLGNYEGALKNWIRLQDSGEYECYYFIADWHALTSDYADTSAIKQNTLDMVSDWVAAGLDPARSTIFVQSQVPEHAELHLILSAVTPLGWLERVPTYKEQRENINEKDIGNYAFLGYPVLQAADIIMYKADAVPVGKDQAPHVEMTREIVRRFNHFYRRAQDVEELWQRHLPRGLRRRGAREDADDDHRPHAHPPHRPRPPRGLRRLPDAPLLRASRDCRPL